MQKPDGRRKGPQKGLEVSAERQTSGLAVKLIADDGADREREGRAA